MMWIVRFFFASCSFAFCGLPMFGASSFFVCGRSTDASVSPRKTTLWWCTKGADAENKWSLTHVLSWWALQFFLRYASTFRRTIL